MLAKPGLPIGFRGKVGLTWAVMRLQHHLHPEEMCPAHKDLDFSFTFAIPNWALVHTVYHDGNRIDALAGQFTKKAVCSFRPEWRTISYQADASLEEVLDEWLVRTNGLRPGKHGHRVVVTTLF